MGGNSRRTRSVRFPSGAYLRPRYDLPARRMVSLTLSVLVCVCPGSYMAVDVSQYDVGEKARFQLPVMKENDTHCIDFNYLLTSPDGSSPGTLNVLVKVRAGPRPRRPRTQRALPARITFR